MNSLKDRLGYYLVGWKKFHNKTLALLESKKTGYDLVWVFNNDVYGKIDWTIPIHDSLENLYKKRAQQLRDQYDYLVLYFSGGADSLNILHSFINNNIFLDEIVMQVPEPAMSTFNEEDKSNKNLYLGRFAGLRVVFTSSGMLILKTIFFVKSMLKDGEKIVRLTSRLSGLSDK